MTDNSCYRGSDVILHSQTRYYMRGILYGIMIAAAIYIAMTIISHCIRRIRNKQMETDKPTKTPGHTQNIP